MTIAPLLLGAMLAWAPPAGDGDIARYVAIAEDIEAVVLADDEAPALAGDDGRTRTAFLLASIAFEESGGFRADVDEGRARGDNGRSVCLMQIHMVSPRTWEGWTAGDLLSDRRVCFRAGLHRVRESLQRCRALRDGDELAAYTHGRCVAPNATARRRWRRAEAAYRAPTSSP
jgi:hypothetical protein